MTLLRRGVSHGPSSIQFRSHSDEQLLLNTAHRRSQSIDLFSLVIPRDETSSFSSLTCSICLSPMIRPTSLPCQHTFCFECLANHQHIRSGSLPMNSHHCLTNKENESRTITCHTCSRSHHIGSLNDLEENQSMELLINTLRCEDCRNLAAANQIDTCLHCYSVLCTKCYRPHIESHQDQSKRGDSHTRQDKAQEKSQLEKKALLGKEVLPETPAEEEKKVSTTLMRSHLSVF